MSKISEKLTFLLGEKGTSYGVLSDKTGIPKSAIHRYATGETTNVPIDRIQKLAEALNVSAEYILGWEDEDDSLYGNHEENINFFVNEAEIMEMYNEINKSENLKLLFDTARTLTPRELEKVLKYMKLVIDEEL